MSCEFLCIWFTMMLLLTFFRFLRAAERRNEDEE